MKYHFRITKADDRFLLQCIELFYCAGTFEKREDAHAVAAKRLHLFLSKAPRHTLLSRPLDASLEQIQARYGHTCLEIIEVPVEPVFAFAHSLRWLRDRRYFSQEDVARRMGMANRSAYAKLEDPLLANPTLNTLVRLRKIFPQLSLDEIFEAPVTPK